MTLHPPPVRWLPGRPRRWVGRLSAAARAAGFWLAVVLPLVYLPALASPVIVDPSLLAAALVGNVLALVVGHGHEPSLRLRIRRD